MPTPQSNFANNLQHELEIMFEIVWKNQIQYDDETNRKMIEYSPGDKATEYNNQISKPGKPRKLSFDWYNPFEIIEKLSESRINVKNLKPSKVSNYVHISMAKPFLEYSVQQTLLNVYLLLSSFSPNGFLVRL